MALASTLFQTTYLRSVRYVEMKLSQNSLLEQGIEPRPLAQKSGILGNALSQLMTGDGK